MKRKIDWWCVTFWLGTLTACMAFWAVVVGLILRGCA